MNCNRIPGEKKCTVCECTFVDKEDPQATRCKSCRKLPIEDEAKEQPKYLHQDVDVVELKKQVDKIMKILEKLTKDTDKRPEYSHKCESCGQVFVSNAAASKHCDECKKAAK
jgi:hypothetical protein